MTNRGHATSHRPGPDESAKLWYDSSSRRNAQRTPTRESVEAHDRSTGTTNGTVTVRIGLFGFLSTFAADNPVVAKLPEGFTLRDAIEALCAECGPDCRSYIEDAPGLLAQGFRIFLNGSLTDELDVPVEVDGTSAELEVILVMANEAG
ncbi:MAG: hypothetical protein QGF21_13545 [Vicinamibacterales bacterium]|nr:hypothetical protein [Vicinamibacterales bacterium]MDP7478027.1 hypothetical protein [Vicinamibacterales bacterium]MDP7672955.1 hypothetical protein [Vicinamibacterales bacterium]HJO38256.1 hypothetical protein [Vicinamibacterales bacterium]